MKSWFHPHVRCAKATNCLVTKRWKGTSYWASRKRAESTLVERQMTDIEYLTSQIDSMLTEAEQNRRLYNRNW